MKRIFRPGFRACFLGSTLLIGFLATACGSPTKTAAPAAPAPAPAAAAPAPAPAPAKPAPPPEPRTVQVAYPAAAMPPYLPSLLVGVQTNGLIKADAKYLSTPVLAVQALLKNEVQFAYVPMVSAVQAIMEGADLTVVVSQFQNEWALVAPKAFNTVQDLVGKRIAVHSESSATNTVLQWTLKKSALKDVKVVVVPGTAARTQALISKQIDASPIGLADVVTLEVQHPGEYHVVQNYAALIPEIVGDVLVVRKDYLAKNGPLVQDYIQALLEVHRKIKADPSWALTNTPDVFKALDPALFKAIVNAYATNGIWDVNGGLTPELTKAMLQLMVETGDIKLSGEIVTDKFADLKPLQAALAKIGKK